MAAQAATQSSHLPRMAVEDALQVLADRRREAIVVTNQGASRLWPRLTRHPLDFNYNPSTMGGAVPLGLGLALAQPQREVIVISGDGSLLMSLGCLVSVVDAGAENFTVMLMGNALYEVTGGQKTPGAESRVDYAGLARASGFPNVAHFWDAGDWQRRIETIFTLRGPRFIWLEVAPLQVDCLSDKPEPMAAQIERFRTALGGQEPFSP